jgi:hypothetical protein
VISQTNDRSWPLTILGSLLVVAALSVSASVAGAVDKPAVPPTPDKPPATVAADKVEAALKQFNLFYQRVEVPGQQISFTVGIQDDKNQSSIQHINVGDCGWKYPDGTEAISVHAYAQVINQANLPAAVGQKIAEYSNSLILTGACMNETGAFAFTGYFFDHGLDPQTIHSYVLNLHWTAIGLKDALDPVLKTAAAEK